MDAIPAAKEAFRSRNIGADQLPPASGPQLPLDEAAEKQRAARVGEQFGEITPSLVQYTTEVLFRDLWLRPALVPRDRSLVTVSALIATGQVAQITYHLNRAMDNGLTRQEAGEVLGHLAFYAGWPNAFSAAPVVKDVIEKRGAKLSPPANERYVRVAQIEVDPSQLAPYKAAVKEQIEAAVRLEPGVLALYCVADKENPARVFVFEMYADIHAYKAHVETAHFRKYKLTTQDMVKSLTLIDTVPVLLGAKP
jgi:alkylhydroperoxidase/carboxymuconolactone decarboxylase family protein YurZ/quinol monooxygenase YgiN